MAETLPVTFTAGATGEWKISQITAVTGASLATAARLTVTEGAAAVAAVAASATGPSATTDADGWLLHGVVSHQHYTTAAELAALNAVSPALGRPSATLASLNLITKSPAWWELAQDERRAIFEETSHHIRRSMDNLPAVARRLHHSRDLGGPFDFLTWFEFAPADAAAFDDLLAALRGAKEWTYVEREVEVRLERA